MSWSNALDYLDYGDFHRLARACSDGASTIHFGYSMNWCTIVFGTRILDFVGEEQAAVRSAIIETANGMAQRYYTGMKWDKLLRLPIPQNPINTAATFGLEHLHYKDWGDYFFDIARREGHFGHNFATALSPTGASTIFFTWSYDPQIEGKRIQTESTLVD